VANYFRKAFEIDWQRARPVKIEAEALSRAPRRAIGEAPPLGFRRVKLSEIIDD
jgi:hypothetical protein